MSLFLSPLVGIREIQIIINITITTNPIAKYGPIRIDKSDCLKTSNSESLSAALSTVLIGFSLA